MLRETSAPIEERPDSPRAPEALRGIGAHAVAGHEAETDLITAAVHQRMGEVASEFDPSAESADKMKENDALVENFISTSAGLFLKGKISAEELARVGDFSVGLLDKVRKDETRGSFKRSESALDEVFSWPDVDKLATPEQDVKRTETLIYFGGEESRAHKRFVEKHGDALVAEPSEENAAVQSMWKNIDFIDYMGDRIKEYSLSNDWDFTKWPDKDKKLFKHTFFALGFTNDERKNIHQALNSFNDEKNPELTKARRATRLQDSIIVMSKLERKRPGAALAAYKRFGIRNFHRYSADLLYRQLKYFEDVKSGAKPRKNVRLAVTATHDHNGAFDVPEDRSGTTKPIYMEANGLGELARALIKTRKIGLISALVVSGHGSARSILMGAGGPGSEVLQDDLKKSLGLKRIGSKQIFTDDPKIFLLSCSNGRKGGIAQTISEITKTKVAAYPGVGSGTIELNEAGDAHRIKYSHMSSGTSSVKSSVINKLKKRSKHEAVTYDSGKKIKSDGLRIGS